MSRTSVALASLMTVLSLAACSEGGARKGIWLAGSSTVFPFANRVAENYSRIAGAAAPRVEALGTGGGIQAFCKGVGPATPDIANASRPMKKSEYELCRQNGVTDIVELKIGYDGIVIATARNGGNFDFRLQDIYLGMAKTVPDANGSFVDNPAVNWSQINPALPNQRIQVYGPPPTSGTRDAFLELGMAPGAELLPALAALSESDAYRFETIAHTVREDNLWVDSGENDNAILQTLTRTPGSLGVFGFSFLEQNLDTVKPELINGIAPSVDTIANGTYPLARSLYIYVKAQHVGVTPGLAEFVREFMSDASAGRGGYMQDKGLVPLLPTELEGQQAIARAMSLMTAPAK